MKGFFYGIVTGVIAGAVLAFVCFKFAYHYTDAPLKEVTTTQISGEKIAHSGFNYTEGTIKFTTKADGKGEILTEIPKTNIPEARAWIYNTNAVMLELLVTDERIYGVSYLKRWNNFSAGGGVLVSERRFEGVKLQAQYWFSI